MILILSQSIQEQTTEEVIDWIIYRGGVFKRLNGDFFLEGKYELKATLLDTEIKVNLEGFNLNDCNIVWHRRWMSSTYTFKDDLNSLKVNQSVAANLKNTLLQELRVAKNFCFRPLVDKKWLPAIKSAFVDKIDVLRKAQLVGLNIPESLVTNSRRALTKFFETYSEIITKPLFETSFFEDEGILYSYYTKKLTLQNINELPEIFAISFFQKNIQKFIEIRTFFLENEFFSMAIFSQNDKKTQTDFREYNSSNPNRTVPFKLDSEVERKLFLLLKELDLNTGSIDLILNTENQIIFLEVNPVGQLGMTSRPCNYLLEKKIAQFLINNDTIC